MFFVYISSLFIFIAKCTPLYEYATVCLAVHLVMDIRLFLTYGYCEYILVDTVPQINCGNFLSATNVRW